MSESCTEKSRCNPLPRPLSKRVTCRSWQLHFACRNQAGDNRERLQEARAKAPISKVLRRPRFEDAKDSSARVRPR
jgi:hypothetical protein